MCFETPRASNIHEHILVFFLTGTGATQKVPDTGEASFLHIWGMLHKALSKEDFTKHLHSRSFTKPLGASDTHVHISVFSPTDIGG